jgi:HemK-related putative methylase
VRWRAFPPDYNRAYRLRSNGLEIIVLPSVFHPRWHFTSAFFAEECASLVPFPDATVLEVGTGTGLVALSAARLAARVVATDVNPAAARCAKLNAVANGLAGKVEIYEGDMFAPVAGRKFDLILCNPPYFRGEPRTDAQLAYMGGPNLEWITRFAREAHTHLAPGGSLACVFGSAADVPTLVSLIEAQGWQGRTVANRLTLFEYLFIWRFEEIRNQKSEVRSQKSEIRNQLPPSDF